MWATLFSLSPEFASLALMVVLCLTIHLPGNDVIPQSDGCASRQSHPFQGAAIGSDFIAMSKVVTALVGSNKTLEVGRRPSVSAIVDNDWTARGGIVRGLGNVPPWVTDVCPINLMDRLALFGLAVNTGASGSGRCANQQRRYQENGEPMKAAAHSLRSDHWIHPPSPRAYSQVTSAPPLYWRTSCDITL